MEPSNPAVTRDDGCGAFSCLPFFVAGIAVLAVVEFLLVLYLLKRLLNISLHPRISPVKSDFTLQQSDDHSISLQGEAWVSPVPENLDLSKVTVKQIRKDNKKTNKTKKEKESGAKEAEKLEIAPVRRHAVLKNKALLLRAPDGTDEEVSLEGCEISTVSSGPGESRKWGKKFPIKLRHRDRYLYRGSKSFLFYAQSGYAKEAWCEAFRAMAATESSLSKWMFETKRKYKEYTGAAEENMPYLTRFYAIDEEERARLMEVKKAEEHADGHPKKRLMWKKLARKASIGKDHKGETRFASAVDEVHHRTTKQPRQSDDKAWKSAFHHDGTTASESDAPPVVDPNFDSDSSFFEKQANGDDAGTSSSVHGESGDEYRARKPRKASKEIEQGVLCLNMVIARLYYDFNQSQRRLAGIHRFFQRLLMKIRKPSYVKSISIKELDLGRHPPFATAVRMLPSDACGALAVEMDLEWLGGGHLTCETRLDFREQETQGEVAAQLAESGSDGDVTAAVLSGLRGDFDDVGSASFDSAVQEGRQADPSNKKGRWMQSVKCMLSRVAEQVSQVPLVLKIRLVSVKGTAVLKLKAPPSDRVWFAFKTMPDIHFEPEPCIGEHRISSGALARLIANQIKVQIRESVVLPYCEDFFLNWMMADKDNWLPHSSFPFPFFDSTDRESFKKRRTEHHSSSSDESGRAGAQNHSNHNSNHGNHSNHNNNSNHSNHNSNHSNHNSNTNSNHNSNSNSNSNKSNSQSAQNKPPKTQARKNAAMPAAALKAQKGAQPDTSAVRPRRTCSDSLFAKPPRSASSEHLHGQGQGQGSVMASKLTPAAAAAVAAEVRLNAVTSVPLQFSAVSSFEAPLLRGTGSLGPPLLVKNQEAEDGDHDDDYDDHESSSQGRARPKYWSSHAEGLALERDRQFLASQVATPEHVNEIDHNSKVTRRARISTLGKKVGNVVKLHYRRPEDPTTDGSV